MEADRKRSQVNPTNGLREKLPRKEILRGKKNFACLFRKGKRIDGSFLTCYTAVLPFALTGHKKYYFAVNVRRQTGSSFYRNKIKRWTREAYRKNKWLLYKSEQKSVHPCAILFRYNKELRGSVIGYKEIECEVKTMLKNIVGIEDNL